MLFSRLPLLSEMYYKLRCQDPIKTSLAPQSHLVTTISIMTDLKSKIEKLELETWHALSISGNGLLPYLSPDCRMLFPGTSCSLAVCASLMRSFNAEITLFRLSNIPAFAIVKTFNSIFN